MTRRAWQFFMVNAGWATPPGRTVCAASLARAEETAADVGLTFEWEWDDNPDLSWMSDAQRSDVREVLGCVVVSPQGKPLASLWGIVDPDRNYCRVIEAELAADALSTYVAPIAGCP